MATKKSSGKTASKKSAPKKAAAKKAAAKKATTKKATAKKATASSKAIAKKSPKADTGLANLLTKIQLELESGQKRKLNKKEIERAQECLSRTGKVLISFKKASFDGDGTGTGTGTGGGTNHID